MYYHIEVRTHKIVSITMTEQQKKIPAYKSKQEIKITNKEGPLSNTQTDT